MNTNENNEFGRDDSRTNNVNPTSNANLNADKSHPDGLLPEDDPAIINPDELATFPKAVNRDEHVDLKAERDNHLVNKHTPVRDGRNITKTDNQPNDRGFI